MHRRLYAICRRRAGAFVTFSFIINMSIFILGWLNVLFKLGMGRHVLEGNIMTNIDDNFKSKGFIPSALLWILYGFNLRVAWHLFSGVPFYLLLTWDLELVLAYIMSVVAVGHMLLSVIYLIIGGFQLHAIIKKKASSFIKLSFAVNIITFGIGLLASWLFVLMLLLY